MKIVMKRLAGAAAMVALAMPSVAMAQPGNPAASLSVAKSVRAPAKANGASKLGGSTLINLAIFAVIVGGGLLLITTGGDDKAKSP